MIYNKVMNESCCRMSFRSTSIRLMQLEEIKDGSRSGLPNEIFAS